MSFSIGSRNKQKEMYWRFCDIHTRHWNQRAHAYENVTNRSIATLNYIQTVAVLVFRYQLVNKCALHVLTCYVKIKMIFLFFIFDFISVDHGIYQRKITKKDNKNTKHQKVKIAFELLWEMIRRELRSTQHVAHIYGATKYQVEYKNAYQLRPNMRFGFSLDPYLFDTYTIPCLIPWHLVFLISKLVFLRAEQPFDDFLLLRDFVWWELSVYRHATMQSGKKERKKETKSIQWIVNGMEWKKKTQKFLERHNKKYHLDDLSNAFPFCLHEFCVNLKVIHL